MVHSDLHQVATMHPRRVGIFGRFGSGNIGNEGSLEAMLDFLHDASPDAVLDFWCSGPEEVTARYGLSASQMHWLHSTPIRPRAWIHRALRVSVGILVDAVRTVSWVAQHDVVILPGTGPMESTLQVRPWETPWVLFILTAAGRMLGTRVALVSVGASPSSQGITRQLNRAASRLAHYCSFRDEYSRRTIGGGLGLRSAPVYPDLVFALPTPPTSPATGQRVVGVGVIDYHGSNDERHMSEAIHVAYLDKLRQFVRWLVENDFRVRLFTGDLDDEVVVQAVLADVQGWATGRSREAVIYERAESLGQLMAQIRTVDTMAASRFHNVLCALKCGCPTVSLGYGVKHSSLMEEMRVADYCQDLRDFDLEQLKGQFVRLSTDRARIREELLRSNRAMREGLEGQFERLRLELFGEGASTKPSEVRRI